MDPKDCKLDFGPAFPMVDRHNYVPEGGMTLRDYFAVAAMTAIVSKHDPVSASADEHEVAVFIDSVSAGAYLIADAMLAERAK